MRERSKAEERLIRLMTKKGGKGFRVLRSAEVAPKRYRRGVRAAADTGHQGGES